MIDTDKIELPLVLAPERPFESSDSNHERMMQHSFPSIRTPGTPLRIYTKLMKHLLFVSK